MIWRKRRNGLSNRSALSQVGTVQGQQKNTTCPNRHLRVSIWSRYFYTAAAILMLNALIVSVCFELGARGVFKIVSVISQPAIPGGA